MEERNKYEDKNLGGFNKVYPVEDEERMQKYQEYLAFADEVYQISTGTRKSAQNAIKKGEKVESAFGSCFTKKPKDSAPKSSKTGAVNKNYFSNNMLSRKYETKRIISDADTPAELCEGAKKPTHSENLINYAKVEEPNQQVSSEDQSSSNKATEAEKEGKSSEYATDKEGK